MGRMNYNRVGKRTKCHASTSRGGFRVSLKRFSVLRFRSRFIFLLKVFSKLRSSYGHALRSRSIKKGRLRSRNGDREKQLGHIRKNKNVEFNFNFNCYVQQYDCNRVGSHGRSNSFYAEAIADCLEFIKSSSVSVDQ